MKIEAVDFFYLSMPVVTDAGDGSQDALARPRRGGRPGRLGRMRGVAADVDRRLRRADVARRLPAGARRGARQAARRPGRHRRASPRRWSSNAWTCSRPPIPFPASRWRCGTCSAGSAACRSTSCSATRSAYPKLPYASQLFGDTPAETLVGCRSARERGFRAVKCGWGPFGRGTPRGRDHFQAAREGLGPDGTLLIDAGQILREDVDAAAARIGMLEEVNRRGSRSRSSAAPMTPMRRSRRGAARSALAGGEASHNFHMARQLIDYGKVALRPDRLRPDRRHRPGQARRRLCRGARRHLCQPHLHVAPALCASLQPYAGLEQDVICEYPFAPKAVAWDMSVTHLAPDANGEVVLPVRARPRHRDEPGGNGEVPRRRRDLGQGQAALPDAGPVAKRPQTVACLMGLHSPGPHR